MPSDEQLAIEREEMRTEIAQLRAALAAAEQQRDEAVELAEDALRLAEHHKCDMVEPCRARLAALKAKRG